MSQFDSHPYSLELQLRIDEICDTFESKLRLGETPRIEDALEQISNEGRRPLIIELQKIEREYRDKKAEQDYRRRFPEFHPVTASLSIETDLTSDFQTSTQSRDESLPEIPGYEIISKLGEGGMGVVYKAKQRGLDRLVAIKMMRSGEFASSVERQRFLFEAEAIAALDHPNIVPVYDVGVSQGDHYLSLKYFEGGSLEEKLRTRRLHEVEAAELMLSITQAVSHAHQRGVLHRDLKPANILLDWEGRPHVADFGLARRLTAENSLTPTGAMVGTIYYMAPEQARGDKILSVTADIYSLGSILYRLLTGRSPVQSGVMADSIRLLLDGGSIARPRTLNATIPADLEMVCLKCLERDQNRRYASASELADDLARYLRGEPVAAQPPDVWDWLRQTWRTRPQASLTYTWSAPVWLGGMIFVENMAISLIVSKNYSVWLLWLVMLSGRLAMIVIVWVLLLSRFREVPATERHSIMTCVGMIASQTVLFLMTGPLSTKDQVSDVLALYPAMTVTAGLCFFMLGSTYFGRFLLVGLLLMSLAPFMSVWPESGPPLLAVVLACILIAWGLIIREPRKSDSRKASPTNVHIE